MVNFCKECVRLRVQKYWSKDIEAKRKKERKRGRRRWKNHEYKEKRLEYQRKYRLKNKKKVSVWNKIQRTNIIKPKGCSICKKTIKELEKHHPDYNLPLDIIWCCIPCHRKFHRR